MKKRFLAIFIVVLMLFSQITVFAYVSDTSANTINPEDKLTDELKEAMSNTTDGEYIPIYIWLNDDYSDELVYVYLSNKLGGEINESNESTYISKRIEEKIEQYKTKQFSTQQMSANISMQSAFENLSVESKISSLRNNADLSSIVTNEEIEECLNNGKSFEEIIELSERYRYLSDYRDSRSNVNKKLNYEFVERLDTNNYKSLYIDTLLPYVTLECKNEYIIELALKQDTKGIGLFIKNEYAEEICEEFDQNVLQSQNEYIMQPHNVEYTGNGVKIGVIEGGDYNANASHLQNQNITSRTEPEANILTHSTAVLGIICGKKILLDGVEYQGIAPNANVYFTTSYEDDILENLNWLIMEKNVAVINLSGNVSGNYYYNSNEQYFDCLVEQYRVVIVKSAGNNGWSVTSPGIAYNIITVGNMSNRADELGKYIIAEESSYREASCLANKPDITAFGNNVCMVYNGEKTNLGSGTSLAASQVTGTIALMMEANNSLIGNPDQVKAILLASANSDGVSETNVITETVDNKTIETIDNLNTIISSNPTFDSERVIVEGVTREMSGSGILNVSASVRNAAIPLIWSYDFNVNTIFAGHSITTQEFYIPSGTTIKFGNVFEKYSDVDMDLITDYDIDLNIEILDSNNNVIMSSKTISPDNSSTVENVELFKVTFINSGTYRFKIYFKSASCFSPSDIISTHIGTHDIIHSTMVITCGCNSPEIIETPYFDGLSSNYYCDNCGYLLDEQVGYSECSETFELGTVTFSKAYQYNYVDGELGIYANKFTVTCDLNNQSLRAVAVVESGDKYYTLTGYIETIEYIVRVFDAAGNPYRNYYVDVNIEYIESSKVYVLYD